VILIAPDVKVILLNQIGCYDRIVKNRVVSATEFKAKCLALLADVREKGDTITVTKRGKAMATVGPVRRSVRKSSEGILAGKIKIPDEVLMADRSDLWEVVRQTRRKR
jgi:prevent-host-death family protein